MGGAMGSRRVGMIVMVKQGSVSEVSGDQPLASSYLVGQDAEGHWLAMEELGRGGGLFASKDAALRYVDFETRRAPGCCHLVAEPVDLSFGGISLVSPARNAA